MGELKSVNKRFQIGDQELKRVEEGRGGTKTKGGEVSVSVGVGVGRMEEARWVDAVS